MQAWIARDETGQHVFDVDPDWIKEWDQWQDGGRIYELDDIAEDFILPMNHKLPIELTGRMIGKAIPAMEVQRDRQS